MSDTTSYSPSKPNEDKGRLLVLDPADHDGDAVPFKLCWFDFRPCNILVDKDTLQITAILNLEFTNAMPAQFAHKPPWWLLLRRPSKSLGKGDSMEDSLGKYQPRLDQFLGALDHEKDQNRNTAGPYSTSCHCNAQTVAAKGDSGST